MHWLPLLHTTISVPLCLLQALPLEVAVLYSIYRRRSSSSQCATGK